MKLNRTLTLLASLVVVAGGVITGAAVAIGKSHHHHHHGKGHGKGHGKVHGHKVTRTPIKHVVVIYQENVSFDHYFGTYPKAANTDGQSFTAAPGTPAVGGLPPATSHSLPPMLRHSTNLLTNTPNSAPPKRLDSSAIGLPGSPGGQLTCDQNHDYSSEQQAFNGGLMNKFVESVGTDGGSTTPFGTPCDAKTVMDYYDGNTVTGLWNYAQHYAMSDNHYSTTFGPSSPGAINLVSGRTGGVDLNHIVNSPSIATPTSPNGELVSDGKGGYTMEGDPQPYWDDCSTRDAVGMTGKNVGDLLNARGLSWGWFQGGNRPHMSFADTLAATGHTGQPTSQFTPNEFKTYFADPTHRPANSSNQAQCSKVNPVGKGLGGTGQWGWKDDYIPHHEPFNYYPSTANPHHLTLPTDGSGNVTMAGLQSIGKDTQSYVGAVPQFNTPNHQYDTSDWDQLVAAISAGKLPASALPAVSFLKAPGYQDGHAAYSDPKDEQQFVAREINVLMKSPDWSSTAVVVAYDDSDGWYDHQFPGIQNPSLSPADNLTNTTFTGPTSGKCGSEAHHQPLAGEQGRCGLGPRQPLLVISPFTRPNHVDHRMNHQASILQFMEYNWQLQSIPGSADNLLSRRDVGRDRRSRDGRGEREGGGFDLAGLFQFGHRRNGTLILNPDTGQPQ